MTQTKPQPVHITPAEENVVLRALLDSTKASRNAAQDRADAAVAARVIAKEEAVKAQARARALEGELATTRADLEAANAKLAAMPAADEQQ